MKNSFLLSCIRANEEIAIKLKNGYEESYYHLSSVGAGGDVSSGLDLWAESVFVKHLEDFGKIESEESGTIGDGSHTIIIDPIDGSSNALSNFPYFGTSVAKIGADGILDSAIVCNLANGDIFLKELGKSLLQGRLFDSTYHQPIVSPNAHIGIFEKAYAYPSIVSKLDNLGLKFRTPGAVALSLAYARTVNYLLFVGRYRIYDFVAGLALCEDLTVIVEEDYVIVSKDKDVADKIDSVVKESLDMNSNIKDS